MPDSRKSRRIADPGLQPERTSLAWFRTLLGYGALMALALKHNLAENWRSVPDRAVPATCT